MASGASEIRALYALPAACCVPPAAKKRWPAAMPTPSSRPSSVRTRRCSGGRRRALRRRGIPRGLGRARTLVFVAAEEILPLLAARLHLDCLDLRVAVRVLDELGSATPAEDLADENDREADVERGCDELLPDGVRRGGRGVRVAVEGERVERLVDPDAARREGQE